MAVRNDPVIESQPQHIELMRQSAVSKGKGRAHFRGAVGIDWADSSNIEVLAGFAGKLN